MNDIFVTKFVVFLKLLFDSHYIIKLFIFENIEFLITNIFESILYNEENIKITKHTNDEKFREL